MAETLRITWFWFGLAALAVSFIVGVAINTRLRRVHSDTWEALGRPGFWNNSGGNGFRSVKFFLLSDGYKRLSDPTLNKLAILARASALGLLVFVLWGVGLVVTG
jgi:hypothetical protein